MTRRLSIETVKENAIKRGYEFLSPVYKNSGIKYPFKCPEKHIFPMKYNHFQQKHGCPICYRENNIGKNHHSWKGGVAERKLPLYDTYAPQINYAEEVRRNPEDKSILQVRCTYCGKWHTPGIRSVWRRVRALEGKGKGEQRFYCSTECKKECPIYLKRKYSALENKPSTSREVQPELRQMVFERDDYSCIKCKNTKSLHCHHIEGIRWDPLQSADIDMCITVCKKCHKKIHQKEGCKPSDMKCNVNDKE